MKATEPQFATSFYGSTLRTWRLAGVRLAETVHAAGDEVASHAHSAPFVTFVLHGGYEERRGRSSVWCATGCAVTHEAGERHADRFGTTETHLLNVAWDGPREEWPPFEPQVISGPAPCRIGRALVEELSLGGAANRLAIECLLAETLLLDRTRPQRDGCAPDWLQRVEERIRDEFRDPPGLAELSREAGVHRSYLARRFHQHYGCTIGELVRELRVGWAKARLERGSRPAAVAIEAGFSDQSHMNRWFGRLLGRPPGSYRRG